jgi:hypothetical protein
MLVFSSKVSDGGWSPQVIVVCPKCARQVRFYSMVRENKCTHCSKLLPGPSNVGTTAKNIIGRKGYHVFNNDEA